MPARVRCFVGLALPDGHRAALAAHLEGCALRAPGYRWVAAGDLHLTLRFLGGLEPAQLDRVRRALARVEGAPFGIALDGMGTFGSRLSPRVAWLRVSDGVPACTALAEAVETACRSAGLEPEARPFRAHVTVARQRREGERMPPLPPAPVLPPWTVEDFVLYESRPDLPSTRYLPIERYLLRTSSGL